MDVIKNKQERFHYLDGLRGIASLLIVIHHSFTGNIVKLFTYLKMPVLGFYFANFTQSGIELFFVLSGIVLLRPYLRNQREFNTVTYFKRRFLRIYPTYFTALVFGYIVIWLVLHFPTWYTEIWKWADLSVYQFIKEAFIFNLTAFYYNLSWWSLQIEILFYIIVPIIVIVFKKISNISLFRVYLSLFLCFILVTITQSYFTKFYPDIFSNDIGILNLSKSLDYPVCFLLGIFLAKMDFKIKQAKIFLCIGLAMIAASYYFVPMLYTGYGFLYAAIIIFAFNVDSIKNALSKPIMIWLGERSYSLFLVHFSVFYLTNFIASHFLPDRNMLYGIITRTLYLPSALFVSMLLFHFVERRQAFGLITGNDFWPWQVYLKKGKAQIN